jgi:membrane protease YdiL (CAAX protease family)
MKTAVKVTAFYGITFVFTVILSIVQQVSGIDAGKIVLPQFGPGIAALVIGALFRKDGWQPSLAVRRIPPRKFLFALGIPVLFSVVLFAAYGLFVRPLGVASMDGVSFAVMLCGMLAGAFGEELGWRGYLQKILDGRANGIAAFLITGILWGLWHVGNYQNGPAYVFFFVLFTIGCSALMAWVLQGTGYNVVLAGLFHFAVNAGFYILKDAVADPRFAALNGVAWICAAAVIVAIQRKEFLRRRDKSADAKPQGG